MTISEFLADAEFSPLVQPLGLNNSFVPGLDASFFLSDCVCSLICECRCLINKTNLVGERDLYPRVYFGDKKVSLFLALWGVGATISNSQHWQPRLFESSSRCWKRLRNSCPKLRAR